MAGKELKPATIPKRKQSIFKSLYDSQIWQSIFRHGWMDNDRNRALAIITNVVLHLHPVRTATASVFEGREIG